jgi:hypothetical protein
MGWGWDGVGWMGYGTDNGSLGVRVRMRMVGFRRAGCGRGGVRRRGSWVEIVGCRMGLRRLS